MAEYRSLPLHAARVVQTEEGARQLKRVYTAEGCHVRVMPRRCKGGGAEVWFYLVVARKPKGTADEKTITS